MSSPSSQAYEAKAIDLLSSFQLIEHLLKVHLVAASLIAEYNGSGTSDGAHAAVKDLPLKPLINKFKKINSNEGLHDRLQQLVTLRNSIAHQALLHRYEFLKGLIKDFETEATDLDREAPRVRVVLDELFAEIEIILTEFRAAATWKALQQSKEKS